LWNIPPIIWWVCLLKAPDSIFGEYPGEFPPNFHHSRSEKNGPSGEISLGVLANQELPSGKWKLVFQPLSARVYVSLLEGIISWINCSHAL